MIWDFRGPDSNKTALHHARHLKEYAAAEGLNPDDVGHSQHSDLHASAFLIVPESEMIRVRDRLIPHRGEHVN